MYEPDGQPTRRGWWTVGVILAIVFSLWFNQRQGIQAAVRQQAEDSLSYCKEIEGLKTLVRTNAIDNYAKLDQNGKLLGITITPELRETAKAELDHKLEQYAEKPCPRA